MRATEVTEFREQLGKEIKRLREVNNMSQNELSKKAGISLTWLQKIEYGVVNTRIETLCSIAKALNCPDLISVKQTQEANDTKKDE